MQGKTQPRTEVSSIHTNTDTEINTHTSAHDTIGQ